MYSHKVFCAHSFLHLLLRQSEAIKFACDWKRKNREIGGKTYKNTFARTIYFTRTGRQPPSSDSSADDKNAFKKFKTRHQRFISSRNCLLELYEKVKVQALVFALVRPLIDCNCTVRSIRVTGSRLGCR
jgi:hypothetical protein